MHSIVSRCFITIMILKLFLLYDECYNVKQSNTLARENQVLLYAGKLLYLLLYKIIILSLFCAVFLLSKIGLVLVLCKT